jgi:multidrug resistance efflux pump
LSTTDKEISSAALGDRVRSLSLPRETVRKKSPGWLWAIAVLLLGGVGWYFLGGSLVVIKPSEPANLPTANAPSTAPTAHDGSPASGTPAPVDEFAFVSDGNVVPRHQILVSPKVSGMIVKLDVEEGRRVAKGQLLAELESIDYAADLERAKAVLVVGQQQLAEYEKGNRPEEVEAARAELAESSTRLKQLRSEWKRREALAASKAVTQSELEQGESEYKAMDRHVVKLQNQLKLMEDGVREEWIERARAQVSQAASDVTKAQWRLDNTRIVAPISGTILKKNAEEGNIVNPIAFNGSYSICEMADLADLEIELSINERHISKIFAGQKCLIESKAYPDRRYQGNVNRMMPIATRADQTVKVRVKVEIPPNEEGVYLKPEMTVKVSFLAEGHDGTIRSAARE